MSYTASLSSLKRVSGTTKTASVKPAPSDSERPSRMSVQEKWARDRKSLFDNKRNSDAAPPLVRRLELARFSFMSIGAIDCIGQFFRAQIFFELRFPGGAKDPDLSAPGDEFAIRNGEPRPPAGWYMKQIDLKNFIEHNDPLNANVKREGDDLYLSMRFEGEFFENMELESFPFDMQELSIDLAINCRPNGKMPVDLCVADDAQIGVSEAGFAQHQLFELDSRMTYMERVTGDLTSACYPTITISARVYRKPGFVIYNVIIPMAAFVIMAFMQFTITDRTNQDARLAVTLTLVLTAAAYKFSISSMVPSISYLTLADKYVLCCSFIIFLLVLEGALVGLVATDFDLELARLLDFGCLAACLLLFFSLHVWAGWHIYRNSVTRIMIDETEKGIATTDPND